MTMHNQTCSFCNKRIHALGDYGTKFCSDDCRYKFNNAQRKYKNKVAKLSEFVEELIEASALDNELSELALQALRQIDGLAFGGLNQWTFKCAKCGYTDFKNHGNASCPDCQSNVWGAIAPRPRPVYLNE